MNICNIKFVRESVYDRTVRWNDIGNTSASNGKRVKEEMMEYVEPRREQLWVRVYVIRTSCPRKKSVYVRMMNRNMIIDVQMPVED